MAALIGGSEARTNGANYIVGEIWKGLSETCAKSEFGQLPHRSAALCLYPALSRTTP